jgi:hypothetical protein
MSAINSHFPPDTWASEPAKDLQEAVDCQKTVQSPAGIAPDRPR